MDQLEEQFDGEATLTASRSVRKNNESGDEGQLTVDVFQTDNEIIIKSTIAGVNADDLDISLTSDMVTIRGVRQSEEKIKDDNFYHQELYWGAFSRSIILPEDIDVESAKASLKNGLLTLRLPKLSKARTKKVRISSFVL